MLGSSRVLGLALHRQPDFLSELGDDEILGREHTRAELITEAIDALVWRDDEDARRAGLRRFKRRHLLRIGARDVLGLADLETTQRELAHVADACVEAALHGLEPSLPFAVIGLGRLGGEELSYASDIDVLFVYDGDGPTEFDAAERLATGLVQALGATTDEGRCSASTPTCGPKASRVRSPAHCAGTRATTSAGRSPGSSSRCSGPGTSPAMRASPVVFSSSSRHSCTATRSPESEVREIRRMKARIERERIRPGEDPQFHLKLGRGSLSDIEFTVQLLQLVHGAAHEELRVTSTIAALDRLTAAGLLDDDDADSLRDAYRLCERARNARYLLTNAAGDSLPVRSDQAEPLGRMLGFVHRPQTSLRDEYRRVTRRARRRRADLLRTDVTPRETALAIRRSSASTPRRRGSGDPRSRCAPESRACGADGPTCNTSNPQRPGSPGPSSRRSPRCWFRWCAALVTHGQSPSSSSLVLHLSHAGNRRSTQGSGQAPETDQMS